MTPVLVQIAFYLVTDKCLERLSRPARESKDVDWDISATGQLQPIFPWSPLSTGSCAANIFLSLQIFPCNFSDPSFFPSACSSETNRQALKELRWSSTHTPWLSQDTSAYSQVGPDSSSISDLVAEGGTSVANTNTPLSHPLLPLPCALYLLLPVLRASLSSSCHTVLLLHHHPSSSLGSFPLSHWELRESRQGESSCTPFTRAQTSQLQPCQCQLTKALAFPLTHYSLSNACQLNRFLKQQEQSKVVREAEMGGDSPKGRAFPNLLCIQQSLLVPVSKP